MADAEISDYAAEAETLAERVDWARGGELTAALEEVKIRVADKTSSDDE